MHTNSGVELPPETPPPATRPGGHPARRPVPGSSWTGLAASARRAAQSGCARIGTEHLLLTLLDPPPPGGDASPAADSWTARELLRRAGVGLRTATVVVEAVYGSGARRPQVDSSALEPSDRARGVLDHAADLAQARGPGTAPTDKDVLAALLEAPHGIARAVLDELAATARLQRALDRKTPRAAPTPSTTAVRATQTGQGPLTPGTTIGGGTGSTRSGKPKG